MRFGNIRGRMRGGFSNFSTSRMGMGLSGAFSNANMTRLAANKFMRYGAIGALGAGAAYGAGSVVNRVRNQQYGSAALRGGLTAAAGFGAYNYMRNPNALHNHLQIAGGFMRQAARGRFGRFRI